MVLVKGSRVGPFEIVAPLGAGGMGEVFRAHDARLNREVAIKVLPPEFAQDKERLARRAPVAISSESFAVSPIDGRIVLSAGWTESDVLLAQGIPGIGRSLRKENP